MTAQTTLQYTVDLNKGLQMTPLHTLLATEDEKAHVFIVSAVRGGEKVSFAGANVRGYFIRPDQVTVPIDGTVDENGAAMITLDAACYRMQGRFQLAIRVLSDDVKAVVFCGDGSIRKTSTDSMIDEEDIIPSLDELLAQISTIEQATSSANAAAQSASDAAERANAAAEKAENAQGPTGATPNLTIGTVETLPAGSPATANITGTAEDPVLNLGVPKGFDGEGAESVTIYEIGDVYISANSTSPASRFGGTWEQIKDVFLLAAGDSYAAGATGGETMHTLTEAEMPIHNHSTNIRGYSTITANEAITNAAYNWTSGGAAGEGWVNRSTGGGQAHNNMPPYKAYYMWERVA